MTWRLALAASLLGIASMACGARSQLEVGEQNLGGGGSAGHHHKPPPPDCVDQGITYVYVVMNDKRLFAFDPTTAQFLPRGSLACNEGSAFSMAVDRGGTAFVEFNDNNLSRVDTKDGSCVPTTYVPDPNFQRFGMAFVADVNDSLEKLFVSADSGELATIDTLLFNRTSVGKYSKHLGQAELTGTGDGRLFAFGIDPGVAGSHLAEVDPTNAEVLSDKILAIGSGARGWAFANWGGTFWFFVSEDGATTTVSNFDPATDLLTQVATTDGEVVGAGVSTCAPD